MAVRTIVRLGHPALRTPAQPVPLEQLVERELRELVDDMFETMRAARGIGLAAPQVGVELQLFVYADEDGGIAPRVLVNPMVEPLQGELVEDWEGCLSIPGLRGLVPRHPALRVRALDREGRALDYRAEGLEARVVQHEFDHLNGVVFLDRMRDLQSLGYADELETFLAGEPDAEDAAVG
jgi:peptide deformylase